MGLVALAVVVACQLPGAQAELRQPKALTGPAAGTILISASLIDRDSGEHILDLNGANRAGEATSFDVNVTVHSLLCKGEYRYVTFGEDLRNGASTALEAELSIRRGKTTPARLPCGIPLPNRAGQSGAVAQLLNADGEPFRMTADARRPDGSFKARLYLDGLPECEKPYRFIASFFNPHGRRDYRYTVRVLAASARLDAGVERVGDCKLLAKSSP